MADIRQNFANAVRLFGLILACLTHIVGFATEKWSMNNDVSGTMGLWRRCVCTVDAVCVCGYYPEDMLTAWFMAVRAMETLGLISIVSATCSFVWVLFRRQRKYIQLIPTLLIGGAGVYIMIGVGVYAAMLPSNFTINYSFVLCCCSGILCLGLALLMSFAYPIRCRRPGEEAAVIHVLTTTDGVSSEPPATMSGQMSGLLAVGRIEQPGYDQPGNDISRYEHRLPSRGANSPPEYTSGDYHRSGQQPTVIANTQNVPEGNTTAQPSHVTENLQRAQSDRPPHLADTPSAVNTIGQFDGTTHKRDINL